jgi:hypothetical protein
MDRHSQDFATSRLGSRLRLGPLTALAVLLVLLASTHAFAQIAGPGLSTNAPYRVGIDYHATNGDFTNGTFISSYHLSGVRATVLAQLQAMADSGASVVKTTLWQVGGGTSEPWRLSFPLSSQELTNIGTYAADVANTRRPDGTYLDLQFTMAWLGCADYTIGTPSTTVGSCSLPWATFINNARASMHNLAVRLGPITQPTGRRAVSRIYAELEVMIGAKANQDRFLIDLYPYFLAETAAVGIEGSLYFWMAQTEAEILDNAYVDSQYSVLNGHKSLYWVFRSMIFMYNSGLALPKRLDFSFYPDSVTVPYAQLVSRVFADVKAVFPDYRAAVAETYYLADPAKRAELGQAFALSYLARGIPEEVSFWTTPYTGTTGFGQPFDFSSYQLSLPAGFDEHRFRHAESLHHPRWHDDLSRDDNVEYHGSVGDRRRVGHAGRWLVHARRVRQVRPGEHSAGRRIRLHRHRGNPAVLRCVRRRARWHSSREHAGDGQRGRWVLV